MKLPGFTAGHLFAGVYFSRIDQSKGGCVPVCQSQTHSPTVFVGVHHEPACGPPSQFPKLGHDRRNSNGALRRRIPPQWPVLDITRSASFPRRVGVSAILDVARMDGVIRLTLTKIA